MEYCHLCGYSTKSLLHGHLIKHYIDVHNYTKEDAFKLAHFYNHDKEFPKCIICNQNDVGFRGNVITHKLMQTCRNPECIGAYRKIV